MIILYSASFYTLVSGICQPSQFARFVSYGTYGLDFPGGVLNKVATEALCYKSCIAQNPMNGTLGGWNYYGGGNCGCKANIPLAYLTLFNDAPGDNGVTVLLGNCALYSNPSKFFLTLNFLCLK